MNIWIVGASFGGNTDMTQEFIENNIWYDGYAENNDLRNENYLQEVKADDFLIVKSSATKGKNHSITFTKVKAIGKVINKLELHKYKVDWLNNKTLPKDFDGVSYRKTIEPIRNDTILEFANQIIEKQKMNQQIDILKHKKQIILQGAPGTGKTRFARLLAKELIKPTSIGRPIDKINSFFEHYQSNDDIIETRKNDYSTIQKFTNLFPVDDIKNLTLEDYCAGKGDRNNFSWWIESGLKYLGKYSPGSARSYLIYWSRKKEDYSLHGKLLKDYSEPEQAMSVLSKLIFDVVKNNAPEKGAEFLGNGFLLKILSSYYPDYYFPINSEKNIEYALQLFGESTSGLSAFKKNKKLNEIYKSKKKKYNKDISPFDFMRFLYDNFNLKEGDKIAENEMVIAEGESAFIQFHPSYNYEDFVRGIVAETEEGEVRYNVHNKILAEFAEKAIDNPKGNYVLIIDEINRANLSSVLGELIYALEYRGEIVESMYEYEGSRELTLPQNLYVIGTMNTADRSVGNIDYAIRRRFAFIDMPSKIEVLQNFDSYDTQNTRQYAISLYENVEKLFKEEFLSPDFHKEDVMIGHSYFLAKNIQELSMKLEYEIKPILKEYVKDGVLYGEKIINLINVLQG